VIVTPGAASEVGESAAVEPADGLVGSADVGGDGVPVDPTGGRAEALEATVPVLISVASAIDAGPDMAAVAVAAG